VLYLAQLADNLRKNMTLSLEPELNVPMMEDSPFKDLTAHVGAAANSALFLAEHGLVLEPTNSDHDVAGALTMAYAKDPEKTSKKATKKRVAAMTPASLVLTNNILTEFGHSVVDSASQVRYLVTNKLLLETENPDPKIRIRALELLGKVSDVGLFAEKSEVTITHQSSDDLRAKLRGKLEKLVKPVEDIVDAVVIENDEFCVVEELGELPDVEYDD
jgi:hypothetical protein